jgi:hypothetical protein
VAEANSADCYWIVRKRVLRVIRQHGLIHHRRR